MEAVERFQGLLKKLFQFEASDLDFGIYRIMNYKRKQVEDFINEGIRKEIENAFAKHKERLSQDIDEELKKVREKIVKYFGSHAFTPTGDLIEKYKDSSLGEEFINLKEQKEMLDKIREIELQVYNDLYNFFSRYYEEGDFIPQYRYSIRKHKYAIPYNGEEVKLYWANADQYYTKTGILFRDYTFKVGDYNIIFRIVEAKEELNSNKATKQRFFVLDDEPLEFQSKTLVIKFQYRELTSDEMEKYKDEKQKNKAQQDTEDNETYITENGDENQRQRNAERVKQENINEKIYERVLEKIKTKDSVLYKLLIENIKNEKPILLYHILRFTAKNTKDYFIHKNLKNFLFEQLDYYIKSEVLNIQTLEQEKFLDKHITRAKVVREIGEKIIDFLSQIEDFQKRLWEKKKFVVRTEYVITTDRVPEEFYDEIFNNENQKQEWIELGFDIPKTREELKAKKLPVDTKHFSSEFKEKLLEKLTRDKDLDDLLDGLLIKSENWQGLNTILPKFKEKVQTIYIDPPFNKEQDADYLYSVKYKDSTWITMLENRLSLAREFLKDTGSIFVRCDYNGNMYVRLLMNEIFGEENFRNEIIIGRTKTAPYIGTSPEKAGVSFKSLMVVYDNLYLYSKSEKFFNKFSEGIIEEQREAYWKDFKTFFDRDYNRYELLGLIPEKGCSWMWRREEAEKAVKNYEEFLKITSKENITIEEYWEKTGRKLNFIKKEGNTLKYWVAPIKRVSHNNWSELEGYGRGWHFPTENSEILLKRVIESTSNEGDLVMDFFLGSGTTTAVAHKLRRKWIGIEMGEHFYSVVLPRMKRVLAYDKSGISKEKDVKEKYNEKTAGGFFKYQTLEQYEDTLDNIELKEKKGIESLFKNKDEYLLKYFLDIETRESPYLLNIEMLKNPFQYKLKINPSEVGEPKEMVVDIPETFNYILGLKVKKIKVRENNERKYMFILGEKEGRDIAVVWREYDDSWKEEDFKSDKEFITKEIEVWNPNIVY
ncbi:MAG: site-specific DNA-methyltransferase, partial [Hydrogenobacter sp.]